jgi:hypothetical protein
MGAFLVSACSSDRRHFTHVAGESPNADHGPLATPDIGVLSHPQPRSSHLAPVFFFDLCAALLCLPTTVRRAGII